FLVFRGRLSSAVLISRSASKSMAELETKLKDTLEQVSRTAKSAEETMGLEESLGVTEDAYRIAVGATILTAVAALESLLIDLAPDSAPKPRGLQRLLRAFLERHEVMAAQSAEISEMTHKVAKRRNVF